MLYHATTVHNYDFGFCLHGWSHKLHIFQCLQSYLYMITTKTCSRRCSIKFTSKFKYWVFVVSKAGTFPSIFCKESSYYKKKHHPQHISMVFNIFLVKNAHCVYWLLYNNIKIWASQSCLSPNSCCGSNQSRNIPLTKKSW